MNAVQKTSLAIVIPVLNEAAVLSALGESLSPFAVQTIVVDGGSSDNSVELASIWADQVLIGEAGRAAQMNRGASVVSADYLLFLHADTRLPDALDDLLYQLAERRPVWGFFRVKLEPKGVFLSVVQALMNLRSRLSAVATGDQAIFVRRDVFEQLQGYAPIALMEDVELSKRLRRLARPQIWREPVTTSSRRWHKHGVFRTVALMWSLRLLYTVGFSPSVLHRLYYGKR